MGFAPLPDPLHVGRVPEVIAIGRLTQPAPLTGGLAGATASRCATVKLASPVMGVRREEKTAARALAAAGREIHRAPSRKKMRRAGQSKKLQPPRRTREEGRKNLRLKAEENPQEENEISNRQDYPTFIPPLTLRHTQATLATGLAPALGGHDGPGAFRFKGRNPAPDAVVMNIEQGADDPAIEPVLPHRDSAGAQCIQLGRR